MNRDLLGDAATELLGAFTVTFFAAGGLLVEALGAGPGEGTGLLAIAATTGVGYALAVAVTRPRSGGHVNPVVTVAAWLTARLEATRTGAYVVAQVLGGLAAALVLASLVPQTALDQATHGATLGAGHANLLTALTWEIVVGFFYTLAVFATVLDDRDHGLGFLAAGAAAFLGVAVAFPFTGASMNPARSFGPALLSGDWSMHWAYWIGPLLGGALAGGLYDGVVAREEPSTQGVDEPGDRETGEARP